jgi:hypothetical protein
MIGRSSRLLAVLGFIALGAVNWHVLTMPIDISPATVPAGEDAAIPPLTLPDEMSVAEPSAASFPQTLARPLFRADRRPREEAKPDATAALREGPPRSAEPPPGIELVGIMKDGRDTGRALIRSTGEPTGIWVQVGYVLEGWRLSRIEARSVLFEADGQQVQLSLNPTKD